MFPESSSLASLEHVVTEEKRDDLKKKKGKEKIWVQILLDHKLKIRIWIFG